MWYRARTWVIEHLSGKHGQWWLGLFSFTESIFLPLPTDTFMMLILLLRDNARRWLYYATLTMITSVLGAVTGYLIAYFLFDTVGQALVSAFHIEHEFERARTFLDHGTFIFTFIGAVSPIPYKLFVLTAGFMKVDFWTFLLASVVGRSARLYLSAYLVHRYGRVAVDVAVRYSRQLALVGTFALVIYLLWRAVL